MAYFKTLIPLICVFSMGFIAPHSLAEDTRMKFPEESIEYKKENSSVDQDKLNSKSEQKMDNEGYGGTVATFAFCLTMTAYTNPIEIAEDEECAKSIAKTCSLNKFGVPVPGECHIFPLSAY